MWVGFTIVLSTEEGGLTMRGRWLGRLTGVVVCLAVLAGGAVGRRPPSAHGAVPGDQIALTVYMVEGSRDAGASELPEELLKIVKGVKGSGLCQSYRLLDTNVLRVRDGGNGHVTVLSPVVWPVMAAVDSTEAPVFVSLHASEVSVSPEDRLAIRGLQFELEVPHQEVRYKNGKPVLDVSWKTIGINTRVSFPLAEKVLVGKINPDGAIPGSAAKSVFFIVEGRVLG